MDLGKESLARWDVFVSYSRADDAGPALVLAESLRERGLRVFWDDHGVHPFQAISRTILRELGNSLVLLAYFSHHYPQRRACQHELTAAFLAGQREGDPARRILVVNPEPGVDHIHPVQLRDARHARAPRSRQQLADLADQIAEHVRGIGAPLGEVERLTPPLWLPAPARPRPARFVGRVPELWRLHSAIHPHDAPLTVATANSVVVLHGMSGVGKSELVAEYAHRFAAAFPDGVFWLDADRDDAAAGLRRQLADIASAMARQPAEPDVAAGVIATELHRRSAASLWVVDGVRPDLAVEHLRAALGPHPLARSVVTTRRADHASLGSPLELDGLRHADAAELLTGHTDDSTVDQHDLADIVSGVGGHPQALNLFAQHGDLAGIADSVRRDRPSPLVVLASPLFTIPDAAADLLRAITALQPAPAPLVLLAAVHAGGDVREALSVLAAYGMVRVDGDAAITPALVGHLVRTYDPQPRRYREVRDRALRAAVSTLDNRSGIEAAANHAHNYAHNRVNETERELAWRLQVELAHCVRAVIAPEATDHLRAALSYLYSLFLFSRQLLSDIHPAGTRAGSTLAATTMALQQQYLRPLLQHWHPALKSHEARLSRPDPIAHERTWSRYAELATALRALHESLLGIMYDLAVITGSRYGLPPVSR